MHRADPQSQNASLLEKRIMKRAKGQLRGSPPLVFPKKKRAPGGGRMAARGCDPTRGRLLDVDTWWFVVRLFGAKSWDVLVSFGWV